MFLCDQFIRGPKGSTSICTFTLAALCIVSLASQVWAGDGSRVMDRAQLKVGEVFVVNSNADWADVADDGYCLDAFGLYFAIFGMLHWHVSETALRPMKFFILARFDQLLTKPECLVIKGECLIDTAIDIARKLIEQND